MALPDLNLGYRYDKLPGRQSIRLVTIHPAENITDSIKCSLETVDLIAEKDKYDALSYSWGMDDDSGDAFLLTLDDKPFPVTENLWDGLRRIRLCKDPVRIWIDAVCINQNDDPEKSVQVAMMADIYAGAHIVHVWLGEGEDAAEDSCFWKCSKKWKSAQQRWDHGGEDGPISIALSSLYLAKVLRNVPAV
jgi:PhoPQ-activated pathogenicity-related protein